MEQPNGDELIPPGGPRNALVVMFGEYHYGQGAVMLIGGYGRSVKDGNAARGKAEQWVDEHFGPGAPTLWDGPRSNVSYRVAGPVIVPNLPQGVTRAEVEKATIPVRRALRSTLKRCARETRRK